MEQNWNFKSESRHDVIYTVQELEGKFICNCPSFAHSRDKNCRHIKLIRNGLAGIAVNQEPAIVPCAVSEVRVDGKNILVPKFHNIWDRVKIIYHLRQLGISKRKVNKFFGDDYGSDKEIEEILENIGYLEKKAVIREPVKESVKEFEKVGFENMACVKISQRNQIENLKRKVPAFALMRC